MAGRPKFQIDYAAVEKLAEIQCTMEEIASFLGCSTDTLKRDEQFCLLYKKGMDQGKMSLRRWQMAAAKKGNVSMLIWLGKQRLGQRDTVEVTENKDIERVAKLLSEIQKEAHNDN